MQGEAARRHADMATRSASSDLPPHLVIGALAVDLAAAGPGTTYPEWIKIAPRGATACRDGRTFSFDPEALSARFAADAVKIPVDVNHSTVLLAPKGESAPAHGWIGTFEARPDGLYGQAEWLPNGKALLDARTHRYVSPAFPHDAAGNAKWMHSVALVSAPALSNMPALASAGPQSEPTMKSIATALGLQGDANETACLTALTTLQTTTVAKSIHDEALAKLSAATTELVGLKEAGHKAVVEGLLETALKEGKMVPAQKEHYATLAATPSGLETVKGLLAATAPNSVTLPSKLDGKTPSDGGTDDVATLTAKASVYQKQQHDAGNMISWSQAVRAVEEKPS